MVTQLSYNKDYMSALANVCIWWWCMFRDKDDNKKVDFKVISWCHKGANNMRNASIVAYKDSQGRQVYAEVEFFFHTRLPAELGSVNCSSPESLDIDTEDEGTRSVIHHLAFICKVPFECRGHLVKTIERAGAQAVI